MRGDQYVAAQNGAVRLAERDLERYLRTIDHLPPERMGIALLEFWPALVRRYGEVTATVAADRFEDLTGMGAVLAPPLSPERVGKAGGWAALPLKEGDFQSAMGRFSLLTDELVKQPGRDTIIESVRKQRIRVARVPTGAKTCAFCVMLASRGAVYHTEAAALAASHGKCDCRLEPVVDDSDMARLKAEGYDPNHYGRVYQDNVKTTNGRVDTKATLAAIRESEGSN